MIVVYRSFSQISVSVLMPSGLSKRVCFDPLSDGTSQFRTSDELLQQALERHPRYRRLFSRDEVATRMLQPIDSRELELAAKGLLSPAAQTDTDTASTADTASSADTTSAPADSSSAADSALPATRAAEKPFQVLKFIDVDEARDHFVQRYQLSYSKLRSRDDVVRFAKCHGFDIQLLDSSPCSTP